MAIAGDLAGKVCTHGNLSEESSRQYFAQIISAIHYMHENHVIHRDIKPQNVLINAGDVCKVADLGKTRSEILVTSKENIALFSAHRVRKINLMRAAAKIYFLKILRD